MSKIDLGTLLAQAVTSQVTGVQKPVLIPNWRETVKHAWSFKLDAAGIGVGMAEFAIQALSSDPPVSRGLFALIGMAVTAASMILRLVRQAKVSGAAE